MSKDYSQQLLTAYNQECRNEISIALSKAYLHSFNKSQEFGSFWFQAQSYMRWFYVDALLESMSRRLGLSFEIGNNVARNCKHIAIHSNNWKMTIHHIPGRGPLPKQAKYRATYAHQNYDLFNQNEDHESEMDNRNSHVYLLHDGKDKNLSILNLTIPTSDNQGILYTESLPVLALQEVEAEKVDSEIEDKIKILTELQLRSNNP